VPKRLFGYVPGLAGIGSSSRALIRCILIALSFSGTGTASAQLCEWSEQSGQIVQTCGKVGIGTDTPFLDLHVKNATSYAEVTIQGVSGPNTGLRFIGDRIWKIGSNVGTVGTGKFTIFDISAAKARMVIDTSGRVGIGTTVPEDSLDVNGGLHVRGAAATDSPAVLHMTASGPNGSNRWSMFAGSASGAAGVPANDFWLYEYPSGGLPVATIPRLAIRRASTPSGTAPQPFVIDGGGRVGIGTLAPAEALHVTGNIVATGDVSANGAIYAKYQDLAEWVPATEDLTPGTVVVLNPERDNEVMASHRAYDTTVAGVVSAQPGVILGEASPDKETIATTGRVRMRVDARKAPIAIGDLLVTSDVSGLAMRSAPIDVGGIAIHRPGTLIGKALQPLAEGMGEILVLLSLQ
jgi:hypothetical protein